MTKAIMTSTDLKLSYGDFEALHGIDLEFYENEITALIGPSGCGKSTYLRSLNRMNDLVDNVKITGSIKLAEQEINQPNIDLVALRKTVGMVFQQPNPFAFSVYDNVSYGLKIAGVKDKAVLDEAVETSLKQAAIWDEVKDQLSKNAAEFSGGQQQRICIARVLATKPKIVLMDEPTSALDPISSSKIEDTLLALKDKYTFIMVTHNLKQAARISDRTAFFMEGNVVEYNLTNKIFINPEQQLTEDYVSGNFG